MKYLQTFKDKINDWQTTKLNLKKIEVELREESNDIAHMIVNILDELTSDKVIKTFNINIKSNGKIFYKIENDKTIMKDDRDKYLHSNGASTSIFWKDEKNGKSEKNILWNMNTRDEYYVELADILDGLIRKYNKVYKAVLMKKDLNKFNL